MNRSNPSKSRWHRPNWLKNRWIRIFFLVWGTFETLLLLFYVVRHTPVFKSTADNLVRSAANADYETAVTDYRLAAYLYPTNHESIHKLADLYLADNNPDAAIAALKSLPIGESGTQIASLQRQTGQLDAAGNTIDLALHANKSAAAYAEKSRILLEQGRGSEATDAARSAFDLEKGKESIIQLGLCYLATDEQQMAAELITSVADVEALQTLKKAELTKYHLASVLYSGGLLRSAERVLNNAQASSAPEWRLLGQIEVDLAQNDSNRWAKAKEPLEKSAVADPANLDGHKLLLETYQHLKLTDEANKQQELISRLETGKV